MIINMYKPKDWTSFDVVAKIRSTLKVKKVGHAGTLDPLAEGVLIVLTDKDTKNQSQFMKMEKEYLADICLGAESPTYDLEMLPNLVTKANEKVFDQVKDALETFVGEQEQIIPAYSAKKIGGKEMYKLSRKGEVVPEQKKTVTIRSISVLKTDMKIVETIQGKLSLPHITVKVICSSGTFIRSLAFELGQKLKTGGVLASLVRTRIGDYKIENSVKIEDLLSQQSL